LLEVYPCEVLHTEDGTPLRGFRSLKGTGIWRILHSDRPDAILLTQLRYRFDWAAYASALVLGIPIWLRTETQDQAFRRTALKSLVRSFTYRFVYKRVDKAFVIGKLNAGHYRSHGVAEHKLIPSPYCVVDRFEAMTDGEKLNLRGSLRAQMGFSDEVTVLLFCGKLQQKKNPGILVKALDTMPSSERSSYGVAYVGSGELEGQLRSLAASLPDVHVHFAGFKNQSELPAYYLACDVLVLPSRQMGETWGLVVNEALLADRRAILSKNVGCAADFSALPSVTVFDASVGGLVEALRSLPNRPMTNGQRDFMSKYSVRAAAEGILKAMVAA
jgi:glycosyltransferase involved in cell wall biosynthesis